MRMRVALLVLALLAGGAFAGLLVYRSGAVQLNRPAPDRFPITGIDVSHHQGAIDWKKVAASGVTFAFIKASEGRDFTDRRFAENWRGATAAGIPVGAYHFFTFCSPGREQAAHFLRTAPPVPGALPPVADVEFVGNCKAYGSLERVRGELRSFLDAVAERWGAPPILYVTPESWEQVAAGRFGEHPVWIRSVLGEPAPDAFGGWLIWQFSETGRVPGVRGPVDLNVLRPGAELRALVR
jgi:lysozyme